MCMKATKEGCVLLEQLEAVKKDVVSLDARMTAQEDAVKKMREETQNGFKEGAVAMREINVSIANLAHDFGERMNAVDRRLVAEKEKWGETLRSILVWTVRVILAGCAVAMGVTAWGSIFGK